MIVFDGNCHAQHLAAMFNGSALAETYAVGNDFGFVPSYKKKNTNYVTEGEIDAIIAHKKTMGYRVFQASQVTQLRGTLTATYSGEVEKIARYPQMEFYACSPDAFEAKYGSRQPLQRILCLDLGTIEQCVKHCDTNIDFVESIKRMCSHGPLFHCVGHPGGFLTSLLFRSIADQFGIFDEARVSEIQADLAAHEAINFDTNPGYPVQQEILDELDFKWPSWYSAYRAMIFDARAKIMKTLLET